MNITLNTASDNSYTDILLNGEDTGVFFSIHEMDGAVSIVLHTTGKDYDIEVASDSVHLGNINN